jgi:hypothetical protein
VEVRDHPRSHLARAARRAQRLGGEVAVQQQHAAAAQRRQVEVGHPALQAPPVGHQEAALPRALVHQHHRDGRRPLARHHQAPRDDAGAAQEAPQPAAVRVVAHQREHVGTGSEPRGLHERRARHAPAGDEALAVARALGGGLEVGDHVEVVDHAQPEPDDAARAHSA